MLITATLIFILECRLTRSKAVLFLNYENIDAAEDSTTLSCFFFLSFCNLTEGILNILWIFNLLAF